jgi:hypothetical protein
VRRRYDVDLITKAWRWGRAALTLRILRRVTHRNGTIIDRIASPGRSMGGMRRNSVPGARKFEGEALPA